MISDSHYVLACFDYPEICCYIRINKKYYFHLHIQKMLNICLPLLVLIHPFEPLAATFVVNKRQYWFSVSQ